MGFDVGQIVNLVGQLGGDHQQAAQQLQGMGEVDPQQHAGLLSGLGVDPQQLQQGGYQQHFDTQQQPGFEGFGGSGYQSGGGGFDQGGGGFDQGGGGFEQGGGGYEQAGGGFEQGGGYESEQREQF